MDVISELNTLLENSQLESDLKIASKDVQGLHLFIIAPPRSGSTLLQQILISRTNIGYVSNLMARFWKSPAIARALQDSLFDDEFVSSFNSSFGNTIGAMEPHEWGWFWQDQLGLVGEEHYIDNEETIDWRQFRENLDALISAKAQVMMFDNVFAMSNMSLIKKHIDNCAIIVLERDPYWVSNSMVNARLSRYDNLDAFYGHRPRDIDELLEITCPYEQIVRQVKSIFAEMKDIEDVFDVKRVCKIKYEHMVENPESVVQSVVSFLDQLGSGVEMKDNQVMPFTSRNQQNLVKKQSESKLDACFKLHFS